MKTHLIAIALVSLIIGLLLSGCGITCRRIENDRNDFLSREATNEDTHAELSVPFELINDLISPQVNKIKSFPIKLGNLGKVGSYFGNLSIKPKRIEMLPASNNHVGVSVELDIKGGDRTIFTMTVETEVEPDINLRSGKIDIELHPESFKKIKPRISRYAQKSLGGYVYERIPGIAKKIIRRSLVDKAASRAVKFLVSSFYNNHKDKLLRKLGDKIRISLKLPNIPLKKIYIRSYENSGGGLVLPIVTGLPVREGLAKDKRRSSKRSRDLVTVRISASATAELANWALAEGLIPNRYDKKGKPKKDGVYQPGLDWIPGEKPMKIYLWDLDKPCMRITMAGDAKVESKKGKVHIKAVEAEIEDVKAAAFTKAGVWFYSLWKDALNVTKSTGSKIKLSIAGQKLEAAIEKASLKDNELKLQLSLDGDYR